MKRYWKWILTVVAILLVGLLIWFIFFYNHIPRLSKKEKEKVEEAYFIVLGSDEERYVRNAIIWYDENGNVEENKVWRYVGKYGDCYAFLMIGDNKNSYMEEVDIPYPIRGLSRFVYYPTEVSVMLYHTKRGFTLKEIEEFDGVSENLYQVWRLEYMRNREEWITDEQLEQLTQDVEKIAAAHN